MIAAKSFSMIDEGDVLVGVLASGAGYGDPLRRDPAAVARDVGRGARLGRACARRSTASWSARAASSTRRRRSRRASGVRAERLALGRHVEGDAGGGALEDATVLHPVSDTVEAVVPGRRALAALRPVPLPLRALRPRPQALRADARAPAHRRQPAQRRLPRGVRAARVLLPGCATALAADVQLREDPIIDESRLAGPGEAAHGRAG